MNEELFNKFEALTFDDVLIVPGYTEVLPDQVDVSGQLTPGIRLNIPLLSAAMDTVTEARMAIALAREGGIGIIHRHQSPQDQAAEVDKVKRSQSGMIVEPITLPPSASLREAEHIMSTYHISGVPIAEDGGKLVGILTNRDVRFVEQADYGLPVSQFMTAQPLVTARVGISLQEAQQLLQKHKIEKLPLVDDAGIVKGLITVKDIQKRRDFPNAAKDYQERLLVGAAVGVGADLDHRHGRASPEQLRHQARVRRVQVRHDHEGHPAIGGDGAEEPGEGVEPSGRRTQADARRDEPRAGGFRGARGASTSSREPAAARRPRALLPRRLLRALHCGHRTVSARTHTTGQRRARRRAGRLQLR
jgi:IMP dehydrogenase/GMP reductase